MKYPLTIIFLFLLVLTPFLSSLETFGFDNPTLPKLEPDPPIDPILVGNFSFDGDCLNGGVEINNGTICAQRLQVFNITNLNVTKQDLTITDFIRALGNVIFNQNFTVNTNTFFVDSNSGIVGIGTITPNATLDVRGSAVFNQGGGSNDFRVEGVNEPNLIFVDASQNRIGFGLEDPKSLWHLNSGITSSLQITTDGTGKLINDGFAIQVSTVMVDIKNFENTGMRFFTNNLERIKIESDGKIGINTTTPQNTLNVLGDGNFTGNLTAHNITASGFFFGDGSQLTGISGEGANIFDQVLNKTSNVTFFQLNVTDRLEIGTNVTEGSNALLDIISPEEGITMVRINNTDQDLSAETTLLDLLFRADGDPNAKFITMRDAGENPVHVFGSGLAFDENNPLYQATRSDGVNVFTIASDGRIGINTTTPQNTLNVVGQLNVTGNSTLDNVVILFPSQSETAGSFGVGGTGVIGILEWSPTFSNSDTSPNVIEIVYRSNPNITNDGSTSTLYNFGVVQASGTLHTGTGIAMSPALFDAGMTYQIDDTNFKLPSLPATLVDRSKLLANNVATTDPILTFYATIIDRKVFASEGANGDLNLSIGASPIGYSLYNKLVFTTNNAGGSVTVPKYYTVGALNPTFTGAGTEILTEMAGLYIDDLTSPINAYGIRSILSSGVNRSFINHTGTAKSFFGGVVDIADDLKLSTDLAKLFFGASQDVSQLMDGLSFNITNEVGSIDFFIKDFKNVTIVGDLNVTGTIFGGSPVDIGGGLNVSGNLNAFDNFTVASYFFLSNDYSLPTGQNKILKRNSATKAVFGVSNDVGSASTDSGVGYVLNTTVGEYRIDLHSILDTNNANDTVHHLLGSNNREIWRLNPTADSEFRFEKGLDSLMVKINRTAMEINQTLVMGTSTSPQNITMFSPDGTSYSCGVLNGGTFACS